MKLTVFFSKDGDCILLTGADGKMVLADGGRRASYNACVAEALSKLSDEGKELERVYISHIDADHVEGVERMLEDLVDWEVFKFKSPKNPALKEPKSFCPMKPKAIWHNSFHDQAPKHAGEITDVLAASATVLSGLSLSAPVAMQEVAIEHSNLATSMAQAFNISTKIRKNLLNIKLNPEFEGKLMILDDEGALPKPIKIGGMDWYILGPMKKHIEKLRNEWDAWLKKTKGKDAIKKVKNDAAKEEKDLTNSTVEVSMLMERRSLEASMLANIFLGNEFAEEAKKDGRDGVTTPNLASLSFLVEEKKGNKTRTVLMTGDAHWRDLREGLQRQNKLDAKGNLHVDVLKVQHHGATANILELEGSGKNKQIVGAEFLDRVTADHYVFCGISGKHENPEEDVVRAVLDSRLGADKKGKHKKTKKFKLWFNGSSKNTAFSADERAQIKKIEKLVAERADASRFEAFFLPDSSFELPL